MLNQDLAGLHLPPLGRQIQRSLHSQLKQTAIKTIILFKSLKVIKIAMLITYLATQQILRVDIGQARPLQDVPQHGLVPPLGRDVQHRLTRSEI